MHIPPILHSTTDSQRQRIEHAMHSHLAPFPVDRRGRYPGMLSDTESDFSHESSSVRSRAPPPTLGSATSSSSDDDETVEYPRSTAHAGMRHLDDYWRYDSQRSPTPVNVGGKHASTSKSNLGRKHGHHREPSYGELSGVSPGSTVGHHASRMTLGAGGMFENRPRERRDDKENDDEYDPERRVENLVRGIDPMPRSNIFAKKSPPPPPPPPPPPSQHHLAHLAPRHHRPVQPSPLRSLVVPSPDPSVTSRSQSTSKSRAIDRSDEREREREADAEARHERYQTRVEDAPDEGTPRRAKTTTTTTTTAPPHHPAVDAAPRVRVTSNPETRTASRTAPPDLEWADMTRLTGMLATPRKGAAHGVVSDDGPQGDGYITDALKDALARMQALQDETALARRRIRQLEADLDTARAEGARNQQRVDEVEQRNAALESEKKELEKLVVVLRRQVAKITQEWHVEMERTRQLQAQIEATPATGLDAMMQGVLQRIGQLEGEVGRLRSVVERAVELKDETLDETRAMPDDVPKPTQYQQGLVAAAYGSPIHTVKPLTPPPSDEERPRRRKARTHAAHTTHDARSDEPQEDPATSPFPAIRGERLENEFFAPTKPAPAKETKAAVPNAVAGLDHALRHNDTPPQTLVMSVLREIEEDYQHYLGIYTDLADQYKRTSPLSIKRNILAEHLKQVIDTIELKANQVARLTQVLQVKDKLYTAPIIKAAQASKARMSVPETVRAVRKDLGKSIVSTPLPQGRHEHAIV